MMKPVLLFTAASAALILPSLTLGAEPYDGSWNGTIEGGGGKCPPAQFVMQIKGTVAHLKLEVGARPIVFEASVSADGAVTGSYDRFDHTIYGNISGRITGDDFAGRYESFFQPKQASCIRNLTAKRSQPN